MAEQSCSLVSSEIVNGLEAPSHQRTASCDSHEGVLLNASDLQARSKPTQGIQVYNNNNNNNTVVVVECKDPNQRPEINCCDSKSVKTSGDVITTTTMGQTGNMIKSKKVDPHGEQIVQDLNLEEPDGFRGSRPLPNVDITKSPAFKKLETELASAHKALKLKEEEVSKLSKIREEVESELHDLTASLFQEAHRMVEEANVRAAGSERSLHEANMKIDGLETEVAALKTLVLTSTPARPNRHHLHVKNDASWRSNGSRPGSASSLNATAGSPALSSTSGLTTNGSLHNGTIVVGAGGLLGAKTGDIIGDESCCCSGYCQEDRPESEKLIDPDLRKDFLAWKKEPSFDRGQSDFLERLYREDINLCLDFPNVELSQILRTAVEHNTLCINPLSVKEFEDNTLPNSCALFQAPLLCRFQVRLLPSEETEKKEETNFYVCQLARNRIISVCDCLTYLRYIKQGLVKSHHNEVYWHVLDHRRKMALARLGFTPE